MLSEDGGAYAEFATSLSAGLSQAGGTKSPVRVLSMARIDELARAGGGQLVVAVGTPAMTAMARKQLPVPVLNVLVPRASFRKLAASGGRAQDSKSFSAVYFDQPWSRQLALIRHVLPGRRVGILLGKDSLELGASVLAAAKAAGLSASVEVANDEADLLPALKLLLARSDALLAVPDPSIYNRSNIANILLTSYRAKVPLFGFSASYVKAGALASVFSDPAQIAQQVVEIIQSVPATGGLPAPQSPRYFSVRVNSQVQLSLELTMEDEGQLLQRLKQTPESGP